MYSPWSACVRVCVYVCVLLPLLRFHHRDHLTVALPAGGSYSRLLTKTTQTWWSVFFSSQTVYFNHPIYTVHVTLRLPILNAVSVALESGVCLSRRPAQCLAPCSSLNVLTLHSHVLRMSRNGSKVLDQECYAACCCIACLKSFPEVWGWGWVVYLNEIIVICLNTLDPVLDVWIWLLFRQMYWL